MLMLFHKCHIALVTSYKLDSSGTSDQCELLSSLFEMQQVDVNQNLHWFLSMCEPKYCGIKFSPLPQW